MANYSNIQINLVSKETFDRMTTRERLQFIINEVKQGKVLILEQGLTPTEQMELNRLSMSEIDHESYIGIEMPGFSTDVRKPSLFDRLFRRRKAPRMMAVGPAKLMRIIKKEPSLIQTIISPGVGGEGTTGEGIPLDDSSLEIAPEAKPVEGEEEIPESQSKLEQFQQNNSEVQEEEARREELEMLIGPELRDDIERQGEDSASSTAPIEDSQEEDDNQSEPASDSEGGYLLRKIKNESEED